MGDNYYTADQFYPGGYIESFGRQFYISGVDQFTHDFYLEKFNRNFDLGAIEYPKPRDPTERQIPPHNGFGDEIDSLGYVYRLIPEKPKKDFFKSVDNEGKILRFTARFNRSVENDFSKPFAAEATITAPWFAETLQRIGAAVRGPIRTFGLSIAATDRGVANGTARPERTHAIDCSNY
jgi:hypothetical protein